ncbi:DUF4214 domain-containing protein [Desulfobotulus mexicanus]|nr:DUF4214 domain-containing protein [Desulfobotulus mexicanus]
MALTQTQVSQLYVALFGRASEGAGNKFWQGAEDMQSAAQGMVETDAAEEFYGDKYDDDAAFVEMLYLNTMNKAPDAEGLDHWVASLEGGASRGEVAAEFIAAIEDNKEIDPVGYATFNNRVAVSDYTADKVPGEDLKVSELDEFVGYVSEVTDDESTVAAAKEKVDADVPDPGVPGETITLTTGKDIVGPDAEEGFKTTENNDTIKGVVDNLATKRTLDATDQIDGGEGNNTLQVTMNANFNGFSGGDDGGFMKNVGTVELTNSTKFERSFNAKNVEDVETYKLDATEGAVKLTNLAEAGITVEVTGQAQAKGTGDSNLNIGFDAKAVAGQNDALTLGLNGVGRLGDLCDNTDNPRSVVLKTNGIEHLTLNAMSSYNRIDLDGNGSKTLTVTGAGTLAFSNVASTVTSVDASDSKGTVTGDLTGITSSKLASIEGGSGDNSFTVNVSGLSATAAISGGEGSNALRINADNTTSRALSLDMQEVGKLTVAQSGALAGRLTIDGTKIQDLETFVYARVTGPVVLANMQTEDLTVALASGSASTLTYDGYGNLAVATVAGKVDFVDCKGDLQANVGNATSSSANVVAVNASNVTFMVSENSTYTGEMTAAEAELVTLVVKSAKQNAEDTTEGAELTEFNGTLTAAKATQVNVLAEGAMGAAATLNVDAAETLNLTLGEGALTLNAKEANQIDITASEDFTLTSADLNKVQVLNITTAEEFTVDASLNALSQSEIRGNGAVEFDQAVGSKAENIEINARELKGDFIVELADQDVTGVAQGTAEIIGSNIGTNEITVGEGRDVTVVGGIQDDVIWVKANGEHTLTGGLGADIFNLTDSAATSATTAGVTDAVSFTAETIASDAEASDTPAEVMTITLNGVEITVELRAAAPSGTVASELTADDVGGAIATAISEAVAATDATTNELVNPELQGITVGNTSGVVTITLAASTEQAGSGLVIDGADLAYIAATDPVSETWDNYEAQQEYLDAGTSITGKVTITDFSLTGGDQLALDGTYTLVEADASGTPGSLELALAGTSWAAVEAAAFASTGNSVFEFGGNTYVTNADATAGFDADDDLLVELTGVTNVESVFDLGLQAA